MTLIEVLAALVLLAGLGVASAQWIQLASTARGEIAPRIAWSVAADRSLRVIADDLNAGDFGLQDRVRAENNVLIVGSRADLGGRWRLSHTYMLEGANLVRRSSAGQSGDASSRVLIAGVGGFEYALSEDGGVLVVTVRSESHGSLTREFVLR